MSRRKSPKSVSPGESIGHTAFVNPVFVDATGRRVRATPVAVRGMTALLALLLGVTVLSLFGGVPMPGLTSPVKLPAGESSRTHDDLDITNPDSAAPGTSIDVALLGGTASPPSSQSASPPSPTAAEPASTGLAFAPAFMAPTATDATGDSSPIYPVPDTTPESSPTPAGTPTPDPVPTDNGST